MQLVESLNRDRNRSQIHEIQCSLLDFCRFNVCSKLVQPPILGHYRGSRQNSGMVGNYEYDQMVRNGGWLDLLQTRLIVTTPIPSTANHMLSLSVCAHKSTSICRYLPSTKIGYMLFMLTLAIAALAITFKTRMGYMCSREV